MKIVGEIPARLGSKRVERKNLRLLNGKPLLAYAIEAAKQATTLSEIYVNSESDTIGDIARAHGLSFYQRRPELAEDHIVSDQFNYDFLKNIETDILVMINPVSPLITGPDIDDIVAYYLSRNFDTVITVREERLQAFCNGQPVNFNPDGLLPMTQKIPPVQLCCWSVCVWRKQTFIEEFEAKGYAVFSGRVGFYPLDPLKAIKISTEEDFQLAQALLRARDNELRTANEP
jgi:CMP-N-acetylneuraminic acid synthetase